MFWNLSIFFLLSFLFEFFIWVFILFYFIILFDCVEDLKKGNEGKIKIRFAWAALFKEIGVG